MRCDKDRIVVVSSAKSNAISWIFSNVGPWTFHFLLSKIKSLSSNDLVDFKHVRRSANAMVDNLANQGVDRNVPLIAYTM